LGCTQTKILYQEISMKKLFCVVLWLLPVMLFAQSPFDGTWKTNMANSKLSQKSYVFSVNNGMYDCESCAPKIKNVKADGQDQPVSGQPYDTLMVQVVDANSVRFAAKKAGKPEFEQTRTLSPDGKTLTIAITSYPPDGSQSVHTEVKFTRVSKGPAGSNATSGAWRVQNINEDAAGLTTTWKGGGDGLSMSTPTGMSWEAKLDGKEYPVKGIYANETVSVKPAGDRAIEVTYKRDGKLWSVDKITVAPDGKTMTTVTDNKQSGRVSTYVDEKQ
jgi:hypothetical protein